MSERRISCDLRTDHDCEVSGLPAEAWAEAVFALPDEEIVVEINADQAPVISLSIGQHVAWKGTLEDLKTILLGEE
ncbi:hypothetical protein GGQ74_001527 [Desulfobaculum xiamenense]|uniref:Uncharacterized protein n=1 Tax=Desulfobaculum xiamenense TaxID=995050 RepID=A0A846QL27_9BACT|nr:hypothetical protein [Desulfobaculum xiamenense]NJB67887.1 hypothetical protein [Desulfobaculum xiamenense]